ncbi:MAG TPA: carboxypeptidase regulatory-like domain-containing protein [Candidatus Acidoferrum sp.]|nr:carboxypeptidase regulatory-like domain-containing protein [Candidatus Acidoferrum sp.]
MISLLVETGAHRQIRKAGFGLTRALLSTMLLAPLALIWGCAGVASSHTSQPSSQTFSISGTISPAAGGSGTTVALSGATAATTTADSSGNYTFTGLANGTYAVTPSRAGYTFNPNTQAVTVSGANVTGLNFTATAQAGQTFSISGTITPTAGGSGATVTLSGPVGGTTVTNSSGNYTFTGLANGTYAVTPSNTGYTFSPTSQSAMVNGANVTGLNFSATVQLPHSVALAWNASTSVVSSYNVYRSAVSGTGYIKISSTFGTVVSYTDTTVQNGTTYYYVTTAVDSTGIESVYSNQVSAVIP